MPTLIKNVKTGNTIWCKHCGKEDHILALYSETTFGEARVVSIPNLELDDYEVYNSEDFTITGYMCKECDAEEDDIEAIATDDWNEVCKSLYGEKKEGGN